MAAYLNICIEQICGTFFQGCTKAICAWGPHCAETFCTPLVGENLEKLLVSNIRCSLKITCK